MWNLIAARMAPMPAASSRVQTGGTVYRSREQVWVFGVTGVVMTAWMGGLCVTGIQAGKAAAACAIALAGWSAIVFGLWRAIRTGVRAGPDGIRVRNVFTTFDLRWDDIEGFHVGPHGPWPRVLVITLADGQTRRAWGIQGPNPARRPNNRSAERVAEQLNDELRVRTSA